jgi:hypothetical protein
MRSCISFFFLIPSDLNWCGIAKSKVIHGLLALLLLGVSSPAQMKVTVVVHNDEPEFTIPADFVGLGFETRSVLPDAYGVHGYFFSPANQQLITLFRNIGIRNIRVGGGTVDASGEQEHCATPTPTFKDIDQLFEFASAAGIKVIYSVRLLNIQSCRNPDLPQDDAKIVRYIWNKYRDLVDSFSIGNEPDVSSFHSRPDSVVDPAIYEALPPTPGSAYPSYLKTWKHLEEVIQQAAPGAKFSGPDTAVSGASSFVPNPTLGVSWTQQFVDDLQSSGVLAEATQHHYVWGVPRNTTAQEAIDNMLSSAWGEDEDQGMQPAFDGGKASFNPYPFVYKRVLAGIVRDGVPYRMTEANDCLHGVPGASDGFASALWSLDYMHWWAAHHMAGVNFHNNPWLPTDTIAPAPNSCSSGCKDFHAAPKSLGMKAFSLGSNGSVEPVTLHSPRKINLTAYAVGTTQELTVTIINKTHSSTHDAIDASVEIDTSGFEGAHVDAMELTDGTSGDAALPTGTLGGESISNTKPWSGTWTPVGSVRSGKISVTARSTTAMIVRIRKPAIASKLAAH